MLEVPKSISAYFTGKRIIVTGASGYLATALISVLKNIDCTILRLSRKTSLPPASGKANLMDICGDISCSETWDTVIPNADVIYHFAAQTSVYVAEENPVADLKINVIPAVHLLEACKRHGHCPAVIFAGTTTQIGMSESLPVNEAHPDQPITIYDMHKLATENYLKHYARQNIVKATTLRLANVYGPGPRSSSKDRGVINMMIRKALAGEPLTIYGKGDCLRDYVYVSDVVAAFLYAAVHIEKLNNRHFPIGSGQGHTLAQAINLIADKAIVMTSCPVPVRHIAPPLPQSLIESRNFVADTRSFSQATHWQANIDLSTGIDRTMESFTIDASEGYSL